MKKRLLLTLLPLTFLVAACSGNSQEAQEEASRQAQSQSQAAQSQSQAAGDESSAAGDDETSADASSDDIRAHTSLEGEGYEVKIGDLYYTLDEQTADEGRKESYNIENVELTAGDKVSVYLDGGEALSIWAEADTTYGVYPNYDERPSNEQHTEFTVTATDTGNVYFHVNSDDSYSLWLTPNQSNADGGSGSGSGSGETVTGSKFIIYSVTNSAKICDLTLDGSKDHQGRDQGVATAVVLTEGDVIQLYDTENNAGWITTIEGYSFGGENADSTNYTAYLTPGTNSWTVVQGCTVDIYAKFAFNNDSIYFGLHA
ncbi:MAG: hypothetical protein J5618_02680 [Bacilli bacterium]|nr:hypothetical protein [Bacilli bacterium]